MKKIIVTQEIRRELPTSTNLMDFGLFHKGKCIGWEISNKEHYQIELTAEGYSLKSIDNKSFPPKYDILFESLRKYKSKVCKTCGRRINNKPSHMQGSE